MSPQAQGGKLRRGTLLCGTLWGWFFFFFFFLGQVPSHHENCHRSTQGRSGCLSTVTNYLPFLASSLSWEAQVLAALCSSQRGGGSLTTMHHLKLPVHHYRSARCCQCVLFWPSGSTYLSLNRSQEPTRPWIEPSAGLLSRLPAHMAQALFYVLHLVGKASSCRRN